MIIYRDEKGADLRQPSLKKIKDLIIDDREDEAQKIMEHFVMNFTVDGSNGETEESVLEGTILSMEYRIKKEKIILKQVFKGIDKGRQAESIIKMAKMIIQCCRKRERKIKKEKKITNV